MSSSGSKGETQVIQPTPAQRTIARRAAESRATIPDLELSIDLASRAPLDTSRLVRACALALREHPRVNAAYRDGQFELYSRINIGLVLAEEDSYLIPTLFEADGKTMSELGEEIRQLRIEAARGQLPPRAFSGATFTLWSAGELGLASASIPVIPPQAAALVAGTSRLTLTCDHRILYGATAAAFINDVRRRLEQEE